MSLRKYPNSSSFMSGKTNLNPTKLILLGKVSLIPNYHMSGFKILK